jgi:hypothetical protein
LSEHGRPGGELTGEPHAVVEGLPPDLEVESDAELSPAELFEPLAIFEILSQIIPRAAIGGEVGKGHRELSRLIEPTQEMLLDDGELDLEAGLWGERGGGVLVQFPHVDPLLEAISRMNDSLDRDADLPCGSSLVGLGERVTG